MARTTLQDVARTAGVSLATVDRVLNRRPGVHAETAERVQAADRPAQIPPRPACRAAGPRPRPSLRIHPADRQQRLHAGARGARPRDRRAMSPTSASRSASRMSTSSTATCSPRRSTGCTARSTASPSSRSTTRRCARRSTISTAPASRSSRSSPTCRARSRAHYVGIDNSAAGRTAGTLLGRFLAGRTGKVGLIAGSIALRDHIERQIGFEQVIARDFPALAAPAGPRGARRRRPRRGAGRRRCSPRIPISSASTMSAPATAASSPRWRRAAAPATSSSSRTS